MAKKEHIVKHTHDESKAIRSRGESKSDWAATGAMTDAEIEAAVAADPDEAGMVADWANATVHLPRPKAVLNIRVDQDVLDFFRREGKGYQTRINAILRSYVEHHNRRRADAAQ